MNQRRAQWLQGMGCFTWILLVMIGLAILGQKAKTLDMLEERLDQAKGERMAIEKQLRQLRESDQALAAKQQKIRETTEPLKGLSKAVEVIKDALTPDAKDEGKKP